MISLNLLPDIKKEYLKSQRMKQLFVTGAFLISMVAIGSVLLMSTYVFGVQKLTIANEQSSIDANIAVLADTEDLDKILTVKNQLESLPSLHESKVAVSRLFDFIKVLTPDSITLNEVKVDFENQSIAIKGTGDDFKSINTYVDSLKNASFIYNGNEDSTMAFSSVVLDTIAVSKNEESSSFKLVLDYETTIFSNYIEGLKLTVPNITSTQSETERPKSIFQEVPLEEAN